MNNLKIKNQKGFTLIELMVSMFIGLIVFGGVFATFKNQKLLYARQETIIKMGQDTRAALNIMKSFIRRAGISVGDCSPNNPDRICAGLKAFVTDTSFTVSADLNLDGKILETGSLSGANESEVVRFWVTNTISGGNDSLYICPKDNDADGCQFILDNVKTFTIKGCTTDTNGVTTCATSVASTNYHKVDSIEITIAAESKNNEITQGNQKIDGSEITARVFFINKAFQ